jgi:hypothetical protein
VLIKWSNMTPQLVTWEDKVAVQQQFPSALAWGQAGSKDWRGSAALLQVLGDPSRFTRKPNSMVVGPEWVN